LKTLILTILALITSQVYAGDLVILDRYHIEKSKSSATNLGVEHEQGNKENTERRGEIGVRGEESDGDTQVKSHNRNIDSFVIRKSKHNIKNTENNSLLEYHF